MTKDDSISMEDYNDQCPMWKEMKKNENCKYGVEGDW